MREKLSGLNTGRKRQRTFLPVQQRGMSPSIASARRGPFRGGLERQQQQLGQRQQRRRGGFGNPFQLSN